MAVTTPPAASDVITVDDQLVVNKKRCNQVVLEYAPPVLH